MRSGVGFLFFSIIIGNLNNRLEIGRDNHAFIKTVADGLSEYPLTDNETRGRLVESVISIFQK